MKTKLLRKLRRETRKIRVRLDKDQKGLYISSKNFYYEWIGYNLELYEHTIQMSLEQKLKCIRSEYILDKVKKLKIYKIFKELKKL